MQELIISLMEKYGYLGTFLLIFIENIFPPIPSEVILTFGGFMTRSTSMTVFGMVIAATLGSVLGAVTLYYLGHLLNRDRLVEIVTKYGSVLRVKVSDIDKAESWFIRYGNRTVFFCRMVPILRSLISIPAGMAEMKFQLFLFYTTLGTLIWNVILVSAGALLGENWERVLEFMDVYSSVAYTAIILGGLGFLLMLYLRKRKPRNNS
ncbi:MAG TPA: DedA family protein [Clostridiaceae bacterium]|nr:DedA family protein [Clostridiaceae bacterium]